MRQNGFEVFPGGEGRARFFDERNERGDRLLRFRRDAGDAPDRLRRFEERRVVFGGEIFEPRQGNAPDAARREINDAAERNDVVRVVNQLQVSAKVFYFLAVEELESANELERNAVPLQGVFEVPRERRLPDATSAAISAAIASASSCWSRHCKTRGATPSPRSV